MSSLLSELVKLGPQLTSLSLNEREAALKELTSHVLACSKEELSEKEGNPNIPFARPSFNVDVAKVKHEFHQELESRDAQIEGLKLKLKDALAKVATLLEFYCSKVEDNPVLLGTVVDGLLFLCSCKNFPENAEQSVVRSLIKDQHVQALAFSERQRVLRLLYLLLRNHLNGLVGLQSEFVLDFLQSIDGERDPRNLVVIFNMHLIVLANFSLGPFTDELFDVVACYFPIDFKADSNTDVAVTSEELASLLRRCLTGCAAFGHPCLTLIREHLGDATNSVAKREALLLLESALEKFPPELFSEQCMFLWNDLRKQILIPKSTALERSALRCLSKLITVVQDNHDRASVVSGAQSALLATIFKDCEPFLCNPEMSLLNVANDILIAAASACDAACRYFAQRVIPLLLEKIQCTKSKKEYAELLLNWLAYLASKDTRVATAYIGSLSSAVSELLATFVESQDLTVMTLGFAGLRSLLVIQPEAISDGQLETAVSQMRSQNVPYDDEFLFVLAQQKWPFVKAQLLDKLIAELECHASKDEPRHLAHFLAALIHDSDSYDAIMPSLLTELSTSEQPKVLIDALLKLVDRLRRHNVSSALLKSFGECVTHLFQISMKLLSSTDSDHPFVLERIYDVLMGVGFLVQEILLLDGSDIDAACENAILALEGSAQGWLSDSVSFKAETVSRKLFLVLVDHVFACANSKFLDKNLARIEKPLADLIEQRLDASAANVDVALCLWNHAVRVLASLVNKTSPALASELLSRLQNLLEPRLNAVVEDATSPAYETLLAVKQWAWITKAVVLRNLAPYWIIFVTKLIGLFQTAHCSGAAISGFELVLTDSPEILSQRVRANVSLLYKQRICAQITPILLDSFNRSKKDFQVYYFQAVTFLLDFAKPAHHAELPKLLPLLLDAVQSEDLRSAAAALSSLELLLCSDTAQAYFRDHSDHLHALIGRLASLALLRDQSLELRLVALRCLKDIAKSYAPGQLYACRTKTAKQLVKCLSDHKRLVRHAAADVNNQWQLIGT